MEKSDTLLADSIPQEQISLIVVMDQNPKKKTNNLCSGDGQLQQH
jgi:hypothetical protein